MKQIFPIVPAPGSAFWILGVIGVLLVAMFALFGYIAYSGRHVRFEVSSEGLAIRGGLYGRLIPLADLDLAGARATDLSADQPLQFAFRTNGIGLPGYKAGWFRLKNGDKALAFVTNASQVAYIPTRRGYAVLLSVVNPEKLIRALRATGPA